MCKFIKGALIFTSGMTFGAGLATGVFLKSKDIRKVVKAKIIDKLQS